MAAKTATIRARTLQTELRSEVVEIVGQEIESPGGRHRCMRTFRPVLEREVFVLGGTRIPTRWPLSDFFDGVQHADLGRASSLIASA